MNKIFANSGLMLISTLFFTACATTDPKVVFGQQVAQQYKGTLSLPVSYDYLAYVPPQEEGGPLKKHPMILFLHGMGERGTNVWKVAVHGPPKLVMEGKKLPFIVISPQCPLGAFWNAESVIGLLDHVSAKYPVDKDRIYITGLSMGGFGTWDLISLYPERFAAAAPICGGGSLVAVAAADEQKKQSMQRLPIWAFHGAKDNVVLLNESEKMVNMIKRAGGKTKLTVYPDAQHDSWSETYKNQELYDWFLSHTRKTN